jgi:UDP-2-acetamido-3-amino-2,3-dideoxy-glucuronate N-acetyltransferase
MTMGGQIHNERLTLLYPKVSIHHTACVDEGAQVGEGTRIWHFCHVMPGAVVGKGCVLGQGCFVADGVIIGDNVKIQNNVSVYEGVILSDDVFVGPSAVFTNVINPRSAIARKDEYKPTVVGKGATIGANATIVCGNEIGRYAFIGAGAVATKPVRDYALMMGVPAERVGWFGTEGYRLVWKELRQNFTEYRCPVTNALYKELVGPTRLVRE